MIGNGTSALDISREIATVAKEVRLSSRSLNVKVSKLDGYANIWQHSKVHPSLYVFKLPFFRRQTASPIHIKYSITYLVFIIRMRYGE